MKSFPILDGTFHMNVGQFVCLSCFLVVVYIIPIRSDGKVSAFIVFVKQIPQYQSGCIEAVTISVTGRLGALLKITYNISYTSVCIVSYAVAVRLPINSASQILSLYSVSYLSEAMFLQIAFDIRIHFMLVRLFHFIGPDAALA